MAAISFENVSKRYRKGQLGYRTIREDLYDLSSRLIRPRKGRDRDFIWALREVSFEVERGETLGVIGPNGAGKTTILRLLSGITKPTEGKISLKGRMGVLIELAAGFHPELTGRENIYLNGSILGMTRKEVDRKFNDIVDFAGMKDFLDTPVKRYSSGMMVRLGFSVAVHVDPEILLVDEVLAVGDAAFQRKCLDKIDELRNERVATVFVSHNMWTVQRICSRAIFLLNGQVSASGETSEVIQTYERYSLEKGLEARKAVARQAESVTGPKTDGAEVTITGIELFGTDQDSEKRAFQYGEAMVARVHYVSAVRIEAPVLVLVVRRPDGTLCCVSRSRHDNVQIDDIEGAGFFDIEIDPLQLNSGAYTIAVVIRDSRDVTTYARGESDMFTVQLPPGWVGDGSIFLPQVGWKQPAPKRDFER